MAFEAPACAQCDADLGDDDYYTVRQLVGDEPRAVVYACTFLCAHSFSKRIGSGKITRINVRRLDPTKYELVV